MPKMHYAKTGNGTGVCGRTPSNPHMVSDNTFRTTCLRCASQPEFIDAQAKAAAAKMEAFLAQPPREFREPWRDGTITCDCGSTMFREADRTCYGHYANYTCAECGANQSRLTETGMSF